MSSALSKAGLRILLLDTKTQNPNHYICLAIQQAFMATSGVDHVVKAELHNAVSEAVKHGCNLFFAFDGEELEFSICSRVAAVCGLSVLWVTEDPYELNTNVANADPLTWCLLTIPAVWLLMVKKGAIFLWLAPRPFICFRFKSGRNRYVMTSFSRAQRGLIEWNC